MYHFSNISTQMCNSGGSFSCAAGAANILYSFGKICRAHDGAAVAEVALAPWWRRRLAYAFRFPGVE
jgi:hypothetical protein